MLELTPVDLNSVAVIGIARGDIAVGVQATLMGIACDKTDLVVIAQRYPSKSRRRWFEDEAFLRLMRVRGVQCKARYAEASAVEKAVLDAASDYSVN